MFRPAPRRGITVLIAGGSLILLAALALWWSVHRIGDGEILVTETGVRTGPGVVVSAPWTRARVVGVKLPVTAAATLDLGQGSRWPLTLRAEIALEPDALDAAARRALLEGEAGLRGWLEERAGAAVAELARTADARRLLAEPARMADPLARALAPDLPAGCRLDRLEVSLAAPPEQARRLALAAASEAMRPPLARVLYIGLDGADWEVADAMMRRGELPTLARLVREGVRADLLSYEPMMSPLLWTTAITGRPPDEHRILDFTLTDAHGRRVPISSRARAVAALWQILDAAGQRSAFVNFWASHPPETIDGVLVSDIADKILSDPNRGLPLPAGVVWPPGVLDPLGDRFWNTDTAPADALLAYAPRLSPAQIDEARAWWRDPARREEHDHAEEGRRTPPAPFLLQVVVNSHNLEAIALWLLEEDDAGVVGVYFGEIDQVGHNFQHLAPPPHPLAPADERALYGGAVEAAYRAQDAMLGRLVAAAGPDTLVVIHSDHGFRWGARRPRDLLPYTTGQPVEWHRRQGIFVAWGGPARRGARIEPVTLYEIAPTLLAVRGVPPAETMPGRVRDDILRPEFRERLPGERVADWDPLVAPRVFETSSEDDLRAAREAMVEQLRGLGYVGGDEPASAAEDAGASDASPPDASTSEERPSATYWRNLATWLMNQDRFAEAEEALLAANRERPLVKTYWMLSECRAARGDVDGAIAALEEGYRRFPQEMRGSPLGWLVDLHLSRGDVAGARRALERHGSGNGAPGVIATARGRIAEAEGRVEAARAAYLEALDADPLQVRAAERFFALATNASERARLEPYLRRALERDERIEVYWKMLGLLLAERGEQEAAARAFLRAVELDPRDDAARANAATALMRSGALDRARALYEDLARRGVASASVWTNLGSLRAQSGDWDGAASAWEQAIELGADAERLRPAIEDARRKR